MEHRVGTLGLLKRVFSYPQLLTRKWENRRCVKMPPYSSTWVSCYVPQKVTYFDLFFTPMIFFFWWLLGERKQNLSVMTSYFCILSNYYQKYAHIFEIAQSVSAHALYIGSPGLIPSTARTPGVPSGYSPKASKSCNPIVVSFKLYPTSLHLIKF